MNIVVTGGTGFIGRALCQSLVDRQHHLSVLTRNRREAALVLHSPIKLVEWDGRTADTWQAELNTVDAVINLAGAPIAEQRWTEARKRLIRDSRVRATRTIVDALRSHATKPCVLVNASGIGYYGASDERPLDEGAARGTGFLADLCLEWEAEAMRAAEFGTRVVILRTGMVLEADGGALPKMLVPFRLFAGGPIMPGSQWVSWIHRSDHIGLVQWALSMAMVSGPINAVAPEPVTMKIFCKVLGRVLHRPSWLPVPGFALNILLGELGSLMTTGQRVIPTKAMAEGYTFQYPTLEPALLSVLIRMTDASEAA